MAKKQNTTNEQIASDTDIIRATLADHGVQLSEIEAVPGLTVTLYKVFPARGVRVSSIRSRQDELAVALKVKDVRCVTLKDSVGIEVPNCHRCVVPFNDLVSSEEFRSCTAELPVALGLTVDNKVKVLDLAAAPHLLVAGANRQETIDGLNAIIASLLSTKHPSELQFVFIDTKVDEFDSCKQLYRPYLAALPGTDEIDNSKQADAVLSSLGKEMTERLKTHKLNPNAGRRELPFIVAVIDDYADLTMPGSFMHEGRTTGKNALASLILLASQGHAVGIHLIIATQTLRKDVISGIIKANFPTRIAFRVSDNKESRVILDAAGAEKLLGDGDMLFFRDGEVERIQCGDISADEQETIIKSYTSR